MVAYLVVIFCILNNVNKLLGCLAFVLFQKHITIITIYPDDNE